MSQERPLTLFIRLMRPLFLLGGVLLYALGAGIADYLGATIDWSIYLLGQAWVTLLQLSAQLLNEYFDYHEDRENPNRTPFSGGSGALGPGKLPRATALWGAVTCLAVVASLTVLLLTQANLDSGALVIMILGFLGAIFYSVPPVQLSNSGYGELVTSILVANLVPALAFTLQTGELHRLVAMSTFPLVALHLAMMLAFELPDYATDLKFEKRTLMVRLGWQRGMVLHNALVLTAFLLLGLAMTLGLSLAIGLPALAVVILGLLQIWQMRRIAAGTQPNWTSLTLTAVVIFVLVAYLLAFAFWTR